MTYEVVLRGDESSFFATEDEALAFVLRFYPTAYFSTYEPRGEFIEAARFYIRQGGEIAGHIYRRIAPQQ